MAAFEEYGIRSELCETASKLNWSIPTEIQSEAIPAILGGGDVLIAAETGSGKTGAFCLPVSQLVWEQRNEILHPKETKSSSIKKWELNKLDRDRGLSIELDSLCCESKVPKLWFGGRSTGAVHSKGKYYYEAKIVRDGLCRVGWATGKSTFNIGTDKWSYGFGGTGKKSFNRQFDDYGKSFTQGDVLGCFLDLDNGNIWWSKNGEEFPIAFKLSNDMRNSDIFAAVVVQNSSLSLNYGQAPFAHPPKNGFIGLCAAENVHWKSNSVVNNVDMNSPLCIVVEPTMELIEQTHTYIKTFTTNLSNPNIRCISLSANNSMSEITANLAKGADIVTGSISRISSLVTADVIKASALKFVVIDEADMILQQNKRQVDELISTVLAAPSNFQRQLIVCSATLHNPLIFGFADRFMSFPQWIDLKGMDAVPSTVHHVICTVDAVADKQWIRVMKSKDSLEDDGIHQGDKLKFGSDDRDTVSYGTKILKGIYVLKAIQTLNMEKAIVFCRTANDCDRMETFLQANGVKAIALHGSKPPNQRVAIFDSFKTDQIQMLVCTDVAARGLDISGIPFVISVTLSDEVSNYVHRIGRVGRADRMGLSISLVSKYEEKVWFHKCRNPKTCQNVAQCSVWYDEQQILADVENHLSVTIGGIDSDFFVPVDAFDGKVVYGARRNEGRSFESHAPLLASAVAQLADLETKMQMDYVRNLISKYSDYRIL